MKSLLTLLLCLMAVSAYSATATLNPDGTTSPDDWTNVGGASKTASLSDATDGNYVYATTAGHQQYVTFGNMSVTSGAYIDSVKSSVRQSKSGIAATAFWRLKQGAAGTDSIGYYSGGATDAWADKDTVFHTAPDGGAWTVSKVNDLVMNLDDHSNVVSAELRVTKITLTVYYTPLWETYQVTGGGTIPWATTVSNIRDGDGEVLVLTSTVENSGGQHIDSAKIGGLGGTKLAIADVRQEVEAVLSVEMLYADSAALANRVNDSLVIFPDRASASYWVMGWALLQGIDQTAIIVDSCGASNTTNPCTAVSCTLTLASDTYQATGTPTGTLGTCLRQALNLAAFKIQDVDSAVVIAHGGHGNSGGSWSWGSDTPTIAEAWDLTEGATMSASAALVRVEYTTAVGQVIIIQ